MNRQRMAAAIDTQDSVTPFAMDTNYLTVTAVSLIVGWLVRSHLVKEALPCACSCHCGCECVSSSNLPLLILGIVFGGVLLAGFFLLRQETEAPARSPDGPSKGRRGVFGREGKVLTLTS